MYWTGADSRLLIFYLNASAFQSCYYFVINQCINRYQNLRQMELIGHGAQAKIYKIEKQYSTVVIKERLPKKYRHPDLDRKINESRIKSQSKIMQKLLKKGVKVPQFFKIDNQRYSIEMSYIDGVKLKDHLNLPHLNPVEIKSILQRVGSIVLKVHECGIIHGDLTTSNMIIKDDGSIYLIDFGLSYFKESAQDRAVDLYVLERAFKSTHPLLEQQFNILLTAYGEEAALKKLQAVRQRGRKKIAFG